MHAPSFAASPHLTSPHVPSLSFPCLASHACLPAGALYATLPLLRMRGQLATLGNLRQPMEYTSGRELQVQRRAGVDLGWLYDAHHAQWYNLEGA
jgi:hypothetical protein